VTEWKHVIGIVGGLGPHAHVEFETLLLSATETALGRPPVDQDYPPWVLSSIPTTPNRTTAILDGSESPVDALVRSAERLSEADFAVIPCNTAHAFLEQVRERVAIPFVDMIRVSAERAVDVAGTHGVIGLLAATGTLEAGLYQKRIARIAPEARVICLLDLGDGDRLQNELVMEPIFEPRGIKAGAFRDPERREELAEPMRRATRMLAEAGAGLVLTACTEIPLVLGRDRVDSIPLIDPMAVAAERSITIALGREPLPS
jgi:aspartate racemase